MSKRIISPILAVTCAMAAVGLWYFWAQPLPPRGSLSVAEAAGVALARQALDVSGAGSHVTLITRDTETFRQPALDALTAAFKGELRRGGGILDSVQRIQVDPLRPLEVPPGDFSEFIRKSRDGAVLVSLMGPPLLDGEQWQKLGRIKPKIVAFCPGALVETLDLRRFFEAGHLHAAVVSRPETLRSSVRSAAGPSAVASTAVEDFDHLYLTVKSSETSKLPKY